MVDIAILLAVSALTHHCITPKQKRLHVLAVRAKGYDFREVWKVIVSRLFHNQGLLYFR
jgi:hypothetical protein